MDFLDLSKGKYYQYHTGKFFLRLPEAITNITKLADLYDLDEGACFDYEYVDPTEWRYKQLLGNVSESKMAIATIKTKEPLPFKPKAYILLDNGRLCQMLSIVEDTAAANREAAILMPIPVGTEYILRLVEIENPWELQ